MNPLIRFMRHSLTSILTATDDADQVDIEKIDETLTPNMRALRLVMNMSDHLLSMGTPANSVVHMALGVTDTYCKRKVHIDVSFNQITLSQDRGIDREPLTLIRTISPRATDYRLMRKLQNLASQIANHKVTLDDAENELDAIIANNKRYPVVIQREKWQTIDRRQGDRSCDHPNSQGILATLFNGQANDFAAG